MPSSNWKTRNCTVIASESCFASGVDHCLASDDDHLTAEQGALYLHLPAPRRALSACLETIDLIICKLGRYRSISVSSQNCCQPRARLARLHLQNFSENKRPASSNFTPNPTTTMSSKPKSRWADDAEDAALEAQRKREKEEKKRFKAEKQRKADEAALRLAQQQEAASQAQSSEPPSKRRKLSPELPKEELPPAKLLRFPAPNWKKCRSVEDYEKLNDIEEGAYGWVSRAKDSVTGKVVALKRLKMDNANDGVPVTGLREIQTLMDCEHVNIVELKEVVVGEDTRKIEKYAAIPPLYFVVQIYIFEREYANTEKQYFPSPRLPRTRPQNSPRRHARAFPPLRSKNPPPPTSLWNILPTVCHPPFKQTFDTQALFQNSSPHPFNSILTPPTAQTGSSTATSKPPTSSSPTAAS